MRPPCPFNIQNLEDFRRACASLPITHLRLLPKAIYPVSHQQQQQPKTTMKFGNRSKKDDPMGVVGGSRRSRIPEEEALESSWNFDDYDGGGGGGGSCISPKKGLLQKLNCGASTKYDYKEEWERGDYIPYSPPPPPQQQQHYTSFQQQQMSYVVDSCSGSGSFLKRKSRPVLITVQDGTELQPPTATARSSTNEPAQTLHFQDPLLVREVTPERKSILKHNTTASSTSQQQQQQQEEQQRKVRWRKGIQDHSQGWKNDGDSSMGGGGEDSVTLDSTVDGDDDFEDDSDSDDSSGESSSMVSTKRSKGGSRRRRRLSRRRRPRRSRTVPSTSATSVFGSVAEDLGTVAKMLLTDGTACFSSAAEITRDTLVSSYNSQV
eukprot:scaffold5653_cov147-Cylindrotheca_fusiformis.AAC.20